MVRAKAENGRRQVRESGVQTRRRWPESQKLQIVRESHRPGAVMLEIARENGLLCLPGLRRYAEGAGQG